MHDSHQFNKPTTGITGDAGPPHDDHDLFSAPRSGKVQGVPSGYKSKKNSVLHVPDPMLVTGVLTTSDRYHSKVSDLQDFAAVQICGANKVIVLILVGGGSGPIGGYYFGPYGGISFFLSAVLTCV